MQCTLGGDSVEIALGNCREHHGQHNRPQHRPQLRLPRNLVLHHAERTLLNLDRLVEDLGYYILAPVPLHPTLGTKVGVVGAAESVEAGLHLVDLARCVHGEVVGALAVAACSRTDAAGAAGFFEAVLVFGQGPGVGGIEASGVLPGLDVALV